MTRKKVKVKKKDLEYLTSFRCEHYKTPDDCFNHLEQGGVCNSCWVKGWAFNALGEKDY